MGRDSMNSYNDLTRGTFQYDDFAKQVVSFDGLLFRGRNGISNVTPTDIDGMVQLDKENCFVIFELKYSGGMPTGQSTALTKLCDAIQAGGTNCVLIVAIHNTPYPKPIIAKDAKATCAYWNGKWYRETKNRTLYEIAINFVDFFRKNEADK